MLGSGAGLARRNSNQPLVDPFLSPPAGATPMSLTPHPNNYVPSPGPPNVSSNPVYGSPRHLAGGSGQLGGNGTGPGPSLLTIASLHYAAKDIGNGQVLLGGNDSHHFTRDMVGGDEISEKGNTSRSGSLFNDRRGRPQPSSTVPSFLQYVDDRMLYVVPSDLTLSYPNLDKSNHSFLHCFVLFCSIRRQLSINQSTTWTI